MTTKSGGSSSSSMTTKSGGGMRRKLPMQMIENRDARSVCFSKRRQGLFKKAAELSVLCGGFTAAIAFSPAGTPFSFAYPSVDAVVDRFLDAHRESPAPIDVASSDARLAALLVQAAGEHQRPWWEEPVDGLGFEELERMQAMLEEFRRAVSARADEVASARMGGGI